MALRLRGTDFPGFHPGYGPAFGLVGCAARTGWRSNALVRTAHPTWRSLQREWQGQVDLLALRQAPLEFGRIMNQHFLPGERLGGDQA